MAPTMKEMKAWVFQVAYGEGDTFLNILGKYTQM